LKLHKPRYGVEKRALAGAVRPDDNARPRFGNVQMEVAQYPDAAEEDRKMRYIDCFGHIVQASSFLS
jgi:hypothetical protein